MIFQGLPRIPAFTRLFPQPQWVGWKAQGGKKPPVDPHTGKLADISDPKTWADYKQALARAHADNLPGIGYVLRSDIVGMDLDDCIDEQGQFSPLANEVLALKETYAERSPSGRGIRLLADGDLRQPIVVKGIEVYGRDRYLTVTGAHINGSPLDLRPAPKTLELLRLRAGVSPKDTSQGGGGGPGAGAGAGAGAGERSNENFWSKVNSAALDDLGRWWRALFPKGYHTGKSLRAGLKDRGLQEDIAATRDGIVDFGVHDLGDTKKGRRSPIELVVEHGAARDHAEAAKWLCDRLGIRPEALGWIDWSASKSGSGKVHPTYPDNEVPVEEARAALKAALERHLQEANVWHEAGDDNADAPVNAVGVGTGVGKTRAAAGAIAAMIKGKKSKPMGYAVPTHRLAAQLDEQFQAHGIEALVFRGRNALDPERPGHCMCDNLPAVDAALALGLPVSRTCCKGTHPKTGAKCVCHFFETCGYQRQLKEQPQIWIFAHALLFQAQAALSKLQGLFIDEGFWAAGLWVSKRGLTIDEIEAPMPLSRPGLDGVIAELEPLRGRLAKALRLQQGDGGVQRRHLVAAGLNADDCTNAISLEYRLVGRPPLWPGMPDKERQEAVKAVKSARHARAFVRVWGATRDLLYREELHAVSGRLALATDEGEEGAVRTVRTRGVRGIAKQWRIPTFIMDATLPGPEILKAFFPTVEMLADISAKAPHARVRQVLGAPVAKRKLFNGGNAQRNLKALSQYVIRRWLQVDRRPTVVIAQKDVAEWLRAGLPDNITNIEFEHFNAIAGLDEHKHARLLITLGRTQPGPVEPEAYAGAITGLAPVKAATRANGGTWYDKVQRGIRLRSGAGFALDCDQHPDSTAEAVRWQICEGELVQADGRARGVNRTAADHVEIDNVADVCLPVTVDEVRQWAAEEKRLGNWLAMAVEGAVLDSPADAAKIWTSVWETAKAAEHEFARADFPPTSLFKELSKGFWGGNTPNNHPPTPPPWLVSVTYRPAGRGQQKRRAAFDIRRVADPRAWLESRLGPLAGFEIDDIDNPVLDALDALFDTAVGRPEPPASRFTCSESRHGEPAPPCYRGHLRLCGLEISP